MRGGRRGRLQPVRCGTPRAARATGTDGDGWLCPHWSQQSSKQAPAGLLGKKKTSQPWLRPRERGTTWVEGVRPPPNLPAAQIGPVADPRQARGAKEDRAVRQIQIITPMHASPDERARSVCGGRLRARPPPRAPSTRTSRGPGEGSGRQHRGGAGRPPQEAAAGGGGRGSGGARSGPRVEGGGRPGLTSHCDAPDTSL